MNLTLKVNASTTTRTEEYLGRTWTVVPVVALVQTVVHAANGRYPELVLAEAFSKWPDGWNGRPVFIDHPQVDGEYVFGNSPAVLEDKAVGQIFNAKVKDGKLMMEAWLDNERAEAVPELKAMLERIEAGDPIEISIGAAVETDNVSGEFDGKVYEGRWIELAPDHLALLPEGHLGACSRTAGCGVRAAKGAVMSEPKGKGLLARAMQMVRSLVAPEEMTDNDVRRKLYDALKEKEGRELYVEAFTDGEVVYCLYDTYDYSRATFYTRSYTLSETGGASVGDDRAEVEPRTVYDKVLAEAKPAVEPVVAEAAPTITAPVPPCSCQHPAPVVTLTGEKNMKKEDVLAKLEGATDEQLVAIGAVLEPAAPAAVVPAVVAEPAALAAAPTFESLLAAAPADVRESINASVKVAADRKAVTIKTLRDSGRCDLTDEQLGSKSQVELEALVKLAGIETKAATDYSGQGLPRESGASTQAAPEAPDLVARVAAANAKK